MFIGSFASSWDDTVTTHVTQPCATRHEVIQELWRGIVDNKYFANSVVSFWHNIFSSDGENFDPQLVFDVSRDLDAECQVIRLLFTLEMSNQIEHFVTEAKRLNLAGRNRTRYNQIVDAIDAEFIPHIRAAELTEQELTMVMKRFSESAISSSILFTFEIHEINF